MSYSYQFDWNEICLKLSGILKTLQSNETSEELILSIWLEFDPSHEKLFKFYLTIRD